MSLRRNLQALLKKKILQIWNRPASPPTHACQEDDQWNGLICDGCHHKMGHHKVDGKRECGDCNRLVCTATGCPCRDGYILCGG